MTTLATGTDPTSAQSDDRPLLSNAEALVLGGLGGITPIVVMLLGGEHNNFHGSPLSPGNLDYFAGLALRAVLLFAVGAFAVWIHKDVRTRYAAFRLGVVAPALLATIVSTANSQANAAVWDRSSALLLVQQDAAGSDNVLSGALPPGTVLGTCTILDGLLGRKCGD